MAALPKDCSVIYAPKGQAGEYAPYALNLYRGCGHGCAYCYVPNVTKQDAAVDLVTRLQQENARLTHELEQTTNALGRAQAHAARLEAEVRRQGRSHRLCRRIVAGQPGFRRWRQTQLDAAGCAGGTAVRRDRSRTARAQQLHGRLLAHGCASTTCVSGS
jgi:hypothetical protein